MKKYFKSLIVVMSLLMLVGCVGFSSDNHYTSVKNYNNANENSFFDFYHPKSYFDTTIEKKTLSEIDKIDIFYYTEPQTNYSMSFMIGDIEVAYMVNDEDYSEELKKYTQVCVDGDTYGYTLYTQYEPHCVSIFYPLEDKNIEIIMRRSNGVFDTSADMIGISMMVDALQLNQKNRIG